METYPSKLVENAVNELSKLPGIGKRTALRLVLHLLKQDEDQSVAFGNAVIAMRTNINYCKTCFNISDTDTCAICSIPSRDKSLICVVEDVRDVMAIENTNQYQGLYHILGGVISPMENIGPNDINIDSLIKRIEDTDVKEIIMALPATIEGDTTVFYISKKIKELRISMSTIARGISVGDELEYADEVTLGRSIVNRTPYEYDLSQ